MKDLDGTRRPWSPKLLFVGAKAFMKVATIGDEFLPSTKNSKMCLRR
jgi:hypothetical protein